MKHFNPDLMARAALTRIDDGTELTWDHVVSRITGYGKGMTKAELEQVIGILAASIIQARNNGAAA